MYFGLVDLISLYESYIYHKVIKLDSFGGRFMSYSFDVYSFEINMNFFVLSRYLFVSVNFLISFDRTFEIFLSSSGPVLAYVVCQHEFICWIK